MEKLRANKYSGINAAKYAVTYALKPNPAYRYFKLRNDFTSGDCANFISQCLHAGGAKMSYDVNSPWWYRRNDFTDPNKDTWSMTWTVAHSLYWYLKINGSKNIEGIKGFEVSDQKLLELGDLIFFEDNKGVIFHSTIITSIINSQLLVSQHSFEALNIIYQKSWPAFKYHFIKVVI